MSKDFLRGNTKVLENKDNYYLVKESNQGFDHYAIFLDKNDQGFDLISHSDDIDFMKNDFQLIFHNPKRLSLFKNNDNNLIAISMDEIPNKSFNNHYIYYEYNNNKNMLERKEENKVYFKNYEKIDINEYQHNILVEELKLYYSHIKNFKISNSFYFREFIPDSKYNIGDNVCVDFVDHKGDYDETLSLNIKNKSYNLKEDSWEYEINVENKNIFIYEKNIKKNDELDLSLDR